MSISTTKSRILMLHAFSSNATLFSKRLGALRKECSKDIEFVFVDGPHILQPADVPAPFLDNYNASEVSSSSPDDPPARAWWRSNMERTRANGLEDSLAFVRDLLSQSRFDGVFGFSQGAAMAAVIAALLERPEVYPPFLVDGKPPHPPMQFCVAVSGFRVGDPLVDNLFNRPYSTPTLHVFGRNDIIVIEERSKKLVELNTGARVETHVGGHFVPSQAGWRKFWGRYLRDPLGDIPSPSVTANSGTFTPIAPDSAE